MGGFSIGYGISVSPRLAAFDPDAIAYFTTAGITDNTAKTQINDFVVGIKDLGLWNSMVSWTGRSTQNAGTGNTVYSLGGLGVYNGTKTAGISWGANGLIANTANQYVSFSNPIDLTTINSASILAVLDFTSFTSTGWYSNLFAIRTDGLSPNDKGLRILLYADAGANNLESGAVSIFPDNNQITRGYNRGSGAYVGTGTHFMTVAVQANPNQAEFFYDGSSVGSLTDTTTSTAFANKGSNNYFLGTSDFSGRVATVTGSFYALFNSYISSSTSESIRSLYKTSIGSGLGLP